jgi:hypothetical protein
MSDFKCWACGGKPDLSISFGNSGIDVPVCYSCIGPTIKREIDQRNKELGGKKWNAMWSLFYPENSNAQHPFKEGFPWTPDWMKK